MNIVVSPVNKISVIESIKKFVWEFVEVQTHHAMH